MKKILLISSMGGHYSELKKINIPNTYQQIIITEKKRKGKINEEIDYYMPYGSRENLFKYIFIFSFNFLKALYILIKERPNLIISTGAHTCVPFFILSKFLKVKTIYIESYAKVQTKSLTYKIIKKFSTRVIVQHKSMKKIYENALYFGGIY